MKNLRGQTGLLAPSRPGENQAELAISNLSLRWGRLYALSNISLTVKTGVILSLIGPKGAGKTSLIDCVTGEDTPQQGTIIFNNEDITGRRPHIIARLGICRTYQEPHVFPDETVLSNLLTARHPFYNYNIIQACFFSSHTGHEEARNRAMAELLIELFGMQHIRKSFAGVLSYGMKKLLEIARALAMEPAILILDDPFTGMTREEIEDAKRILLDLNESKNMTIIIAEDDLTDAVDISDSVEVFDFGVKLAGGSPDFVRNHPKVIKLYPGTALPEVHGSGFKVKDSNAQ
jgi:branched-chain amino acid transport system ATP-binding protein